VICDQIVSTEQVWPRNSVNSARFAVYTTILTVWFEVNPTVATCLFFFSRNVGAMPGESFGSGGAGHVRVALTVESDLLKEASIRIRRLADTCLTERK